VPPPPLKFLTRRGGTDTRLDVGTPRPSLPLCPCPRPPKELNPATIDVIHMGHAALCLESRKLIDTSLQGFAPHYDDVDVFILQVSGYKRWRAYAPRGWHALPRFSSGNFNESQADLGRKILDHVLAPGDILYLPRGTIHQAEALEDEHSLHLTLSSHQRCTWLDLIITAFEACLYH
jgi:hypothetical protein